MTARQATAGGRTLEISCSSRVPYHKRHEQPCDGGSQLATAPCELGDEQQGTWPRDQLMRMDARFCDAVERAIALWEGGHRIEFEGALVQTLGRESKPLSGRLPFAGGVCAVSRG